MTGTQLKDMDSYIYSTVILPLKDLDVASLSISSPLTDINGREVTLTVGREDIGSYQHNFQRDEARANSKFLIWGQVGGYRDILADYEQDKHAVRIYAAAIHNFPKSKFLLNKLYQAFDGYTPFGKVTVLNKTRTSREENYQQEDYGDEDD